jgi:signal transduction histidine kinase
MPPSASTHAGSAPDRPGPGARIDGRFELREEIGRGAGGVVFAARDLARGGEVAVKLLRASGGGAPAEEAALRFRREAAALAAIDAPSIAGYRASGELADGTPWIAMERLRGRPLSALAPELPLAPARAARIARDVALALARAHEAGVLHRDIKPDNIVLCDDSPGGAERAVLVDFGLARLADAQGVLDDSAKLRRKLPEEEVAGTFAFMAPEQAGLLPRRPDGRSDLYSLGGVLHWMLSGRPPFAAARLDELLHQHVARIPDPPSARAPGVPRILDLVCAKLLEKDPDERYSTAASLARDLDRLEALAGFAGARGASALDAGGRPAARRDPPLVGRAAELLAIERALDAARRGEARVLVLEGGPGAGASRLLEEARRRAAARGARTLAADCASRPSPADPALAALRGPAGEPGGEAFRCVLLDGGAHADEATARALLRLARGARRRLAAIVAVDGTGGAEGEADADGRGGEGALPGRALLGPIDADRPALETVRLAPLSLEEARTLAAATLAHLGRPGDALVELLHERAEGRPGPLVDGARALADAGLLAPDAEGALALRPGVTPPPARDPDERLVVAIAGLDPDDRAILGATGILRRPFSILTAAAASGARPDDAIAAIDRGVAAGILLEEARGALWRHSSEVARRALAAGLHGVARRAAHGRAAERLLALDPADPERPPLEVAHHLEEAGLAARALPHLLSAGEDALAVRALEAARAAFARAAAVAEAPSALEGLAPGEGDRARRRAWAGLGEALDLLGRTEEAREALERALPLSTAPLERAAVLVRLSGVRRRAGDAEGARDALDGACAALGIDAPRPGLFRSLAIVRRALSRGLRAALPTLLGEKRPVAQAPPGDVLAARLLAELVERLLPEDPPRAVEAQLRALDLAERYGLARELPRLRANQALLSGRMGLARAAARLAAAARTAALDAGEAALEAEADLVHAVLDAWAGRREEAQARRRAVEEEAASMGRLDDLAATHERLARVLGSLDAAEAVRAARAASALRARAASSRAAATRPARPADDDRAALLAERRKLESLFEMGRALHAAHDLDSLLATVVASAVQVTGAERGFLLLVHEDPASEGAARAPAALPAPPGGPLVELGAVRLSLRARRLENESPCPREGAAALVADPHALGLAASVLREALERRRAVVIAGDPASDAAGAPRDPDAEPEAVPEALLVSARASGLRSIVCVPLLGRERPLGLLYLDSRLVRGLFGAREVELVAAFAAQAGLAIENAAAREELERKNRLLRETQARLVRSAKMSALGQLAAGVSHEIRNPLHIISGSIYALKERLRAAADPKVREYLGHVEGEVARATLLTEKLLDLARPSEAPLEPVDANEAARRSLPLVATLAGKRGVALETDLADGLPAVRGDLGELQQVVVNLLLNAVQAVERPGGRVALRTRIEPPAGAAAPSSVVIEVADEGRGIEPQDLDRLFEPFFTRRAEGTGLGLYVSWGIVERHGGRITVASERGRGTTFSVRLPACASFPVAAAAA